MNRPNLHRLLLGGALVGLGLILGAELPPRPALGEVTAAPPVESFKSGGQLAVPILQDISVTLHQIDVRLARLEGFFNKLATTPSRSATRN